jgi:CRP-like cAMP-binding protein
MGDPVAISGKLSFINLADLFQILGGNSSTGTLKITSPYAPNPGLIYFSDGNPINASTGSLRGLKAIYFLFGWVDGTFEFLDEPVGVPRVVKQSRMQITLDALRMLDDGLLKKLGPPPIAEKDEVQETGPKGEEKGDREIIKGPLVDYAHIIEEEEYRAGERIVRQGGHGKWIYVVLEGVANVSKETSKGGFTVARLGEGSFVGTFRALMFGDKERSATVSAEENIRLGLLDTDPLSWEFNALSKDFRMFLMSLEKRLERITDTAAHLFETKGSLQPLSKKIDPFIKRGSEDEALFRLAKGAAYIIAQIEGKDLPILRLGKDDFFGYLPFMDMGHEPGAASVIVSKDAETVKIDVEGIQKDYERLSATFRNLIHCMGLYIFHTTRTVSRIKRGI